jgi:DNA-binding NtrC family response regulator
MDSKIGVLLVEVEILIRLDTERHFEDEGFRVFTATNTSDAISLLMTEPGIQAIFTNVYMSGNMDGLRLAAMVRERWPLVKIIVTSGLGHVALSEIPSGARFFGKPYDCGAVIVAIRDMILIPSNSGLSSLKNV